ncbi:flavin reductase family protein [Burkholderia pseudomallei]|uniref:flavin reductase family protein n=1 Tax=Burkholderia pseudomallei TaxID=28450 RepID=UPI00050F5E9E|nr:flavin reductase family protein [Burkholderia pseudomallei]KGC37607.1 flavin reductase like domain protein [Burkholderia pseudomallei]KGD19385.1 flavin reductase like domain protein [Burkholderia pseudomallei]
MASPWTERATRAASDAHPAFEPPAPERARRDATRAEHRASTPNARASASNAAASPTPTPTPDALAQHFKTAMRRLTSTVSIVATRDACARYGMAATAVSALSTEPPAILVCINRAATLHAPLMRVRRFSLNLLHERQLELIAPFSGKLDHDARFAHGEWRDAHGVPMLAGAQATLWCAVDGDFSYGSHTIVIGRVDSVSTAGPVAPLLWQDGAPCAARALAPCLHDAQ